LDNETYQKGKLALDIHVKNHSEKLPKGLEVKAVLLDGSNELVSWTVQ
jgi:hypothetical protein